MAQGKVFAEHRVHFFVTAGSTSCPPSSSFSGLASTHLEPVSARNEHRITRPSFLFTVMASRGLLCVSLLCTSNARCSALCRVTINCLLIPSFFTLFSPVRYPVSTSPYVQAWGQSGSRSDGGRTMDASLAMSSRDICFSHALVLRPHARVPSPFSGP